MNNTATVQKKKTAVGPRLGTFKKHFLRDWQLYLLILLPMAWLIIWKYVPMYGVQIAFRDYKVKLGILGSPWVGIKHFRRFMMNPKFWQYLGNTLAISLYSLATFPLPILLALIINTITREKFKRTVQTISYLPHFISLVIMVAILQKAFSPINGIYGAICKILDIPISNRYDVWGSAAAFRHLYVWSNVWQNIGWNTIIYLASLSSVSNELHEAATIDGASRWKRVLNIDLPCITGTLGIMLILRCGHIMTVGYEKALLMQNTMNAETSEIVSTYVYKQGLQKSDFSYGTAISLFDSVCNMILLLTVNWISKKASEGDISLF